MTEAEWTVCADSNEMLASIVGRLNERKRLLLACACCHRAALRLWRPENVCLFIETVERFASGEVSPTEVGDGELEVWQDYPLKWMNTHDPIWLSVRAVAALWPDVRLEEVIRCGCETVAYEALLRAADLNSRSRSYRWWKRGPKLSEKEVEEAKSEGVRAERWAYCNLLRDLFGNPFHPVTFSPSWRTDTVLSLARTMYEARGFSAMPILADALQDAGCDSDDVLNHCRDGGVHVRGCWVVDLVLHEE